MSEILLFGLLLVLAYFAAHYIVMYAEKLLGQALGIWRTVGFFFVFLGLLLGGQWLARMLPGMAGV